MSHSNEEFLQNLLLLILTGLSVPGFFITYFLIITKKPVDERSVSAEEDHIKLNAKKRGTALLLVAWVALFITAMLRILEYGRWNHNKIDASDFPDKYYIDGALIVGGGFALWIVGLVTVLRYRLNTDFARMITMGVFTGSLVAVLFFSIAESSQGDVLPGVWILGITAFVAYLVGLLMMVSPVWSNVQLWSARFWMQWVPALNLSIMWIGYVLLFFLLQPNIHVLFDSSARWVAEWLIVGLLIVGSFAQGLDYLIIYPDHVHVADPAGLPQDSEGRLSGGTIKIRQPRKRKN